MHRRFLLSCLAATLPLAAAAQTPDWPRAKPITYVVPFTSGGSTDVIARTLAQKLQEALKQTVIVDNKPGQGGGIGASFVARSAPDGYTLFGGTISTHAINASLYKNLGYDPVKDFEPVALVAFLPNVLLVDPNLGVNSVAELVALLKKDEKKRTFASSGAGTSTHLAGELFADLIGVPLTHIPYKGTPPAMVDVSAGQVTFMFDQMTAALPLLQAGKLKLLAVTTARRIGLAPNTPTMIEAGVAGMEIDSSWYGVFAPAKTPTAIVSKLHAEIRKALTAPAVRESLASIGMEPVGSTPADFKKFVETSIRRYAELVKLAGIQQE